MVIGLANTYIFSWVCAYAPAIWKEEMENSFTSLYASPEKLNRMKLLSVSCGTDDFLYKSARDLVEVFEARNIKHKTFFPGGGHTWMNCKLFLTESAHLLFK